MSASGADRSSRAVRRLVHRVGDALADLLGYGDGGTLVAAVSGGTDSTALALALADAAPRTGWRVRAAHVDHGIAPAEVRAGFRCAAARAAELARAPIAVLQVDAPAELRAGGGGIEAAARRVRYAALTAHAREIGAAAIATGHTLDDQAETVLMRAIRGTGVGGLAGIRPAGAAPHDEGRAGGDAPILAVRPMLELGRADAELLCAAWGAEPCADPSNADPAVLRARIRHEVLPLLRTINPRVAEALAGLALAAQEVEGEGGGSSS